MSSIEEIRPVHEERSMQHSDPQPSPLAGNGDTFWFQGALFTIQIRAEQTRGQVGVIHGSLYKGFGPPMHVHHREGEGMFVLDGEIRFRQGEREFTAGPGTFVWDEPEVPHGFTVVSETARALIVISPGGLEQMFYEGGVPLSESTEPPPRRFDPDAPLMWAEKYGYEVVGPQVVPELASASE